MKKFIMYGAGNIGRGFIGQTFANNGYSVGFIDINQEVISRLNTDKSYPVEVVTNDGTEVLRVENVYGIDGTNIELVAKEIASCDIMATAIGVNVLKFIAKPIAEGLKLRFLSNAKPFNIIICENLIGADEFLKGLIKAQIPEYSDRIDKEVGFVEASIGRMVPVMTEEKKAGNPLRVCVEPYNILPVDKDAFRGEIPNSPTLYPFSPFNLFIQRKLFMHNMSHALCAYLGSIKGYDYIYQTINDFDIKYIANKALIQSAFAISSENKTNVVDLISHADNLIYRFSNKALGDTTLRVGRDTQRKLSSNDRLVGALKLAEKHNLSAEYICIGISAGLLFSPEGDESSQALSQFTKENGVKASLKQYSDYEGKYVDLICTLYQMLVEGKTVRELSTYCEEIIGKEIRV